ncbi:hypothetical protein KC321_g41 [Hortaea werneckii]|nr:hypothetical protein KC321_g41 [Hortaea werneckii]
MATTTTSGPLSTNAARVLIALTAPWSGAPAPAMATSMDLVTLLSSPTTTLTCLFTITTTLLAPPNSAST